MLFYSPPTACALFVRSCFTHSDTLLVRQELHLCHLHSLLTQSRIQSLHFSLSCSSLCVNSRRSAVWRGSIGNSVSSLSKCCHKPLWSSSETTRWWCMSHDCWVVVHCGVLRQCRLSKRANHIFKWGLKSTLLNHRNNKWDILGQVPKFNPIKLNTFNIY